MGHFAAETAITEAGPGRWRCRLDPAWNIDTTPNGGYALTPVVRALRALTARPDPLTVTAHFLRPGLADTEGIVEGRVLRAGRATATATATLIQEGEERTTVTATYGDLTSGPSGPAIDLPAPADLPPPEDCVSRTELRQGVELPIASRVEVRIHPDDAPGSTSPSTSPSPLAQMRGWIRLVDGEPTDVIALPLFADAFPPAVFTTLGRVGWVPTVELTVQVRRRPAPGWVQAVFVCDDLVGGRLVETGTLWDEHGAVVARSRQLGLLRGA